MTQLLHKRYRIQQKLGQGGMGEVFLAEDTALPGLLVALKENRLSDRKTQEQFQREALLLARLQHPNLPHVSDYFRTDDDRQFLVMEYVRGENLQQRLRATGQPMDEEDVLACARQILGALAYLHTWHDPDTGEPRPIIHRDIKPANIKQMPDGRYVLLDFGISKASMDEATALSARAMTPGYSPVEQYGGGTDARSDIYSLGATLYALATGNAPPNATELAAGTPLRPVRDFNRQLSRRLGNVIAKAMAVRVEDRYQRAAEMYEALYDEVLPEALPGAAVAVPFAGGGIFGTRRGTTSRARRRKRRYAVPALLLTVVLLWIVGAAFWLFFSEQEPPIAGEASSGSGVIVTPTDATDEEAGLPVAVVPSATPSATVTAAPTQTPTETPDQTATAQADEARILAILATRDAQATADAPTLTPTPTASDTPANTATPSPMPTPDSAATAQQATAEAAAVVATHDAKATENAPTATSTPLPSPSSTATPTATATTKPTSTIYPTASPTKTSTATARPTRTATRTASPTPIPTSTLLVTKSPPPTRTAVPTATSTPRPSNTPTAIASVSQRTVGQVTLLSPSDSMTLDDSIRHLFEWSALPGGLPTGMAYELVFWSANNPEDKRSPVGASSNQQVLVDLAEADHWLGAIVESGQETCWGVRLWDNTENKAGILLSSGCRSFRYDDSGSGDGGGSESPDKGGGRG